MSHFPCTLRVMTTDEIKSYKVYGAGCLPISKNKPFLAEKTIGDYRIELYVYGYQGMTNVDMLILKSSAPIGGTIENCLKISRQSDEINAVSIAGDICRTLEECYSLKGFKERVNKEFNLESEYAYSDKAFT